MGTLVNGIKEIFATSQSTATHVPVCASDGTPQGRISVGDLASVLGVNAKAGSNGNVDTTTVNSKIANGFYQHPGAIREGGNWGVLFVYNGAGNYIVQLDWEFSTNAYFVRNSTNGGSSWTEWNSIYANIPSFYKNYNSITALANGMGALFSRSKLEMAWNSNDLPTGIYTTDGATVTQTGLPSEITDVQSCVFIHFKSNASTIYMRVMLMVYLPADSSKVAFYFNSYRSTNWQGWHKLV